VATDTIKARRGLSLGARIFLTSALLISLAVAAAVVVTYLEGNRIADVAIERILRTNRSVQNEVRLQRGERLTLEAQLMALDPYFVAYIDTALRSDLDGDGEAEVDLTSIESLLRDRQSQFGFQFGVVLDADGLVLVRTDQPGSAGQDLSDSELLQKVQVEGTGGAGFWLENGRLSQAAVVPLVLPNFDLLGYLIIGFAVDNEMAGDITRMTGGEIAFLVRDEGGLKVPATTLDAASVDRLVSELQGDRSMMRSIFEEKRAVPQVDLTMTDQYRAYIVPLEGVGGEVVGATLGLTSIDQELAGYRQIQRVVLLAGGIAILLALLISFAVSRRTLRPMQELSAAAAAAAQGDYQQNIAVRRLDETGRLAQSFNSLLSELRSKQDFEDYVNDLSRYLPEPERGGDTVLPPVSKNVALLGLELRRFARPKVAKEPEASMEALDRDLRRIGGAVLESGGRVVSVCGHRVLALFDGNEAAVKALAAAGAAVRVLGTKENVFDEAEPPAAAITLGAVATGSAVTSGGTSAAVLGLPVQQLESLLREATAGDILLAPAMHQALGDQLAEAGVALSAVRGVLSTQPLYIITEEAAERVAQPGVTAGPLAPAVRPTPVATKLGPGAVLGERFEILAVLGAGGMGVVYKARDRELDDLVALKTLKGDALGNTEQLERLKTEIRLARRITHPNVVRTFDFGELEGVAYISMEYVRGLTVRYLLDQTQRLPFAAALRLARQLCAGLDAAHAVGVLHRDIKPENLIIDQTGNAKLMDFGIARPIRRTTAGHTAPGSIIGTPHYLSPEQVQGEEVDARADIYASGVLCYEIFTGELPFTGATPVEIAVAHIREEPVPPSQYWPAIPPELEALILRCLAKDRNERFPSAAALSQELAKIRI